MSEKIKPCPFCDSKSTVLDNWQNIMTIKYYVFCKSCQTRSGYYLTEKEAIAAWNTRATDELLEECLEAFEKLNTDVGARSEIEEIFFKSKISSEMTLKLTAHLRGGE